MCVCVCVCVCVLVCVLVGYSVQAATVVSFPGAENSMILS